MVERACDCSVEPSCTLPNSSSSSAIKAFAEIKDRSSLSLSLFFSLLPGLRGHGSDRAGPE